MPRPQYSEMLVNRRRQLGLSISQASQVLRLKEQVLIAFEEGDFDHIPKSGYAQGMLSSYARYLGLNPRIVVQQFTMDLNEYTADARQGSRAAVGSGPYVESRGLLPTSGGPAGDLGAFATTSQPHSRQQSSPLVNQRRYVGTLHEGTTRSYGYSEEDAMTSTSSPTTTQPYASTTRTSPYEDAGESSGTTRRQSSRSGTRSGARRTRSGSSNRSGSRRTGSTRRSGTQRSRSQSSSRRSSRREPQRSGGLVQALFSDPRNLLLLALAVLAVALTIGSIFAIRSCTSKPAETDAAKTVPVSESSSEADAQNAATSADKANANGTAKKQGTTGDAPEGTAASTGAASTAQKPATAQKTEVSVTVEPGLVSWVEVLCDGESKVATTLTGPWGETYDVKDSITIEVGDTSAVTVMENGKQRQFDTKTSGIGSITIEGTPDPEPTEGEDKDAGDGSETTIPENAQDVTSKPEDSKNKSTEGTGDDEFLYTINGYDIYHNAEGDYDYFIDPDSGQRLNPADGSPIG